MNAEERIAELLALAEPLRGLDDDDPAKAPLTKIVDDINAIRLEQAQAAHKAALQSLLDVQDDKAASEFAQTVAELSPPKRGPGRPRKAEQ